MDDLLGNEELVEVPLLQAAGFLQWAYDNAGQVELTDEQHRMTALPEPARLLSLVHAAEAAGYGWMFADGPRQQRPHWLLDLWWVDRPEVMPSYLQLVPCGCLLLRDLRAELQALIGPAPEAPQTPGRQL